MTSGRRSIGDALAGRLADVELWADYSAPRPVGMVVKLSIGLLRLAAAVLAFVVIGLGLRVAVAAVSAAVRML